MSIEVLASEPRMVVHVAICTVETRVFGSSSIKVKDVLDPLHVLLLVFLRHMEDQWLCLDTRRTHRDLPHQCLSIAILVLLDSLDLLDA